MKVFLLFFCLSCSTSKVIQSEGITLESTNEDYLKKVLELQKWSKKNLADLSIPPKWKKIFTNKDILSWNDLWKEIFFISLEHDHCLENHYSCVFQGDDKIYLNKNFFLLTSQLKQQLIIFHELTHLIDKDDRHAHHLFYSSNKLNSLECDRLTDYGGYALELDLLDSLKQSKKLDDKSLREIEKDILSHICFED
ncbi:MAG: hypothetical protein QE271_14125 [Bacteriovoracaceae bacterium]|nr:hypothetical protein [Bacteriovoracaceae bacterium]